MSSSASLSWRNAASFSITDASRWALDVLADILGAGSRGRLYKKLVVEQQLAAFSGAWYSGDALDYGDFGVYASPNPGVDTDKLEAAIDAGADDVQSDANGHVITSAFESLGTVAAALEKKLGDAQSVKAIWKPNLTTTVDEDNAQTILKMLSALEDDDDVQNVFANFEISDEVIKKLTAA